MVQVNFLEGKRHAHQGCQQLGNLHTTCCTSCPLLLCTLTRSSNHDDSKLVSQINMWLCQPGRGKAKCPLESWHEAVAWSRHRVHTRLVARPELAGTVVSYRVHAFHQTSPSDCMPFHNEQKPERADVLTEDRGAATPLLIAENCLQSMRAGAELGCGCTLHLHAAIASCCGLYCYYNCSMC